MTKDQSLLSIKVFPAVLQPFSFSQNVIESSSSDFTEAPTKSLGNVTSKAMKEAKEDFKTPGT